MFQKFAKKPKSENIIIFVILTIFFGYFLISLLSKYDFNTSGLVVAGDMSTDSAYEPKNFIIRKDSPGYDGQFFYRLSLNPFTHTNPEYGIYFDKPAYRQGRILYPLIVWISSLGNARYVSASMVIINVLALTVIAIFSVSLARLFKVSPFFGMVMPLFPGFLVSFSRDLSEIVEMAFVVVGVYLFEKNKKLAFSIIFSLAVLAKETSLVVVVGFLLYEILLRFFSKKKVGFIYFLIPIATFFIKQLVTLAVWGSLDSSTRFLSPLFVPFFNFTKSVFKSNGSLEIIYIEEILYILLFTIIMIFSVKDQFLKKIKSGILWTTSLAYTLIWILYFLLIFSLNNLIWVDDAGFMRIISEFFIFGYLILLKNKRTKTLRFVFIITILMWFFLSQNIITMPP